MKHLLSKEEILLLENKVSWDDSILKLLAKTAFKPFSWLKGSIKKGVQKQKMETLVKQFGLELVDAIKKLDTGEEVKGVENEEENINFDKEDILNKIKNEFETIKIVYDLISNDFNKIGDANVFISIQDKLKDIKLTGNTITSLLKSIPIDKITTDDELQNYIEYVNTINDLISKIKTANSNTSFFTLFSTSGGQAEFSKQYKNNIIPAIENLNTLYESIIEFLEKPTNESLLILENKYELPDKIESLISKEQLAKLSEIGDIKSKLSKYINFERLNTITYEANYLIEQAKDENKAELKRIWDLGRQNIYDHFQTVIDVNEIKKTITGNVDSEVKDSIKKDNDKISKLQKMNITEIHSVSDKFNIDALYAFDVNLMSQVSKKYVNMILLMSPVKMFNELTINKTNYFVFKLFGTYDLENDRIIRTNTFTKNTTNKKMVTNFEGEDNSYYIALSGLRPDAKVYNMFVYSNKGNTFLEDKIAETTALETTLNSYKGKDLEESLKNLANVGNNFKYKINQRFQIETDKITTFPGITDANLNDDKFAKVTKKNHTDLIKILS